MASENNAVLPTVPSEQTHTQAQTPNLIITPELAAALFGQISSSKPKRQVSEQKREQLAKAREAKKRKHSAPLDLPTEPSKSATPQTNTIPVPTHNTAHHSFAGISSPLILLIISVAISLVKQGVVFMNNKGTVEVKEDQLQNNIIGIPQPDGFVPTTLSK